MPECHKIGGPGQQRNRIGYALRQRAFHLGFIIGGEKPRARVRPDPEGREVILKEPTDRIGVADLLRKGRGADRPQRRRWGFGVAKHRAHGDHRFAGGAKGPEGRPVIISFPAIEHVEGDALQHGTIDTRRQILSGRSGERNGKRHDDDGNQCAKPSQQVIAQFFKDPNRRLRGIVLPPGHAVFSRPTGSRPISSSDRASALHARRSRHR